MKRTLPVFRPAQLIRVLEKLGFYVHRVRGSHYILKHPNKPMIRVTVPYHNRDLKRETLQSIVKQSGCTNEEFLKIL